MLTAWQMIFGIAPLLVLGFVIEGNPACFHWITMALFCLLYLAVFGSALTFLLIYWLLLRRTVAKLQSISLITPLGAVMLGWLLGNENISYIFVRRSVCSCRVWMIFRKAEVPEPGD